MTLESLFVARWGVFIRSADEALYARFNKTTIDNNYPPMNKAELIETIQKALGKETSKKAAGDALTAVLDSIVKGVKKDKVVQLIGFGTFKVAARKSRKGRNPKTGASMTIKASKSVRFVPSSAIKKGL